MFYIVVMYKLHRVVHLPVVTDIIGVIIPICSKNRSVILCCVFEYRVRIFSWLRVKIAEFTAISRHLIDRNSQLLVDTLLTYWQEFTAVNRHLINRNSQLLVDTLLTGIYSNRSTPYWQEFTAISRHLIDSKFSVFLSSTNITIGYINNWCDITSVANHYR